MASSSQSADSASKYTSAGTAVALYSVSNWDLRASHTFRAASCFEICAVRSDGEPVTAVPMLPPQMPIRENARTKLQSSRSSSPPMRGEDVWLMVCLLWCHRYKIPAGSVCTPRRCECPRNPAAAFRRCRASDGRRPSVSDSRRWRTGTGSVPIPRR